MSPYKTLHLRDLDLPRAELADLGRRRSDERRPDSVQGVAAEIDRAMRAIAS